MISISAGGVRINHAASKVQKLDGFVSWAALLLLAASATAFAWYVPKNRLEMMLIYRDFKLELPPATMVACAVPERVIIGLCSIGVVIALVVQFLSRSKRSASLFHLLLTFVLGLLFLVYREAMGNALIVLVQGITAQSSGR